MIMPYKDQMGVENKWETHWSIPWKPRLHKDLWVEGQRVRVIQAFRGSCANKDSNTKHGQLLSQAS